MTGRDRFPSAAFRYALRGVAVFPLSPGTKVPLSGSRGVLDASTDHDVSRAVWQRYPDANIGAATGSKSGFWVLDVDRHGQDGHATLARLEAEHGPLPPTIESTTPHDGRHLYFKWPSDGPEIRSSAGRLGRAKDAETPSGLDVRGAGGSVTLPPSVLRDGHAYRWVANGARAFAAAPGWLIEMALPPPPPPRRPIKPITGDPSHYVARAVADELAELARAQNGQRNDSLNRSAFALAQFVLAGALPDDWARAQLEAHAVDLGLRLVEARRTIASAFAAAQPRDLPR